MPRVYKPNPRGKRYCVTNADDLENALKAVKEGMSYRKAATKFSIPQTVIYRHMKNDNVRTQGGQTVLTPDVENIIVDRLVTCSEWGYPMDSYDLRLLVKSYLDRRGQTTRFKNNMPGVEFTKSFLRRHRATLAVRMCQNIKRSRAGVTRDEVNKYFNHLEISLQGVPAQNIVNYDETNLSDDPGRKKVITKRGTKYPERVINHGKAATSIMYAAAADGTVLPTYIVYKAIHMYGSWTVGGPKGTRYNRSKSGWFDSFCFDDWIENIALPYLKHLPGRKILLGDNLSSHLSANAIELCTKHEIEFVFLPANSTHITQPLDVAFFRPLKIAWRAILLEWKKGEGRKEVSIPKDRFPHLLKKLTTEIAKNQLSNVLAGFKKCGILPLDRSKVIDGLPREPEARTNEANASCETDLDNSLISILKAMRYPEKEKKRVPRKKISVQPGKSVVGADFIQEQEEENEETIEDMSEDMSVVLGLSDEDVGSDVESNMEVEDPPVFGTSLKGVGKYDDGVVKIGDWLLVDFTDGDTTHSNSKKHYFIGKVNKCFAEDLKAKFVVYYETKINNGAIFRWPIADDTCKFSKDQIVGSLQPPIVMRRGQLKFNVDCNEWPKSK